MYESNSIQRQILLVPGTKTDIKAIISETIKPAAQAPYFQKVF